MRLLWIEKTVAYRTVVKQTSASAHKKWSFPLKTSSVNMIKSAGDCRFGHIY